MTRTKRIYSSNNKKHSSIVQNYFYHRNSCNLVIFEVVVVITSFYIYNKQLAGINRSSCTLEAICMKFLTECESLPLFTHLSNVHHYHLQARTIYVKLEIGKYRYKNVYSSQLRLGLPESNNFLQVLVMTFLTFLFFNVLENGRKDLLYRQIMTATS